MMIEEFARVVDVEDGFAWIESERTSTCSSCSVHAGCGTGVIAKLLGNRRLRLRAICNIELAPGDHVVIGIPESGLLRGSLAVYAVPLIAMLGGAMLGNGVAGYWVPAYVESGSIAGAAAGLVAAFAWLHFFSRRNGNNPAYQPVVLRRSWPVLPVQHAGSSS
jgi:sigma-E factor negative regulatory protein RseC